MFCPQSQGRRTGLFLKKCYCHSAGAGMGADHATNTGVTQPFCPLLPQRLAVVDIFQKQCVGQSGIAQEDRTGKIDTAGSFDLLLRRSGEDGSLYGKFLGNFSFSEYLYAVKRLADDLFDSVDSLIRLDMSEYMEKHTVSKLIGSPPGYVGYDEAGQLTEKIRRRPYSVVLFDEIEKAHPDVFNVLLQVLDDGRLTDNKGRTVNFKNTLIIFTSNLGSQLIRENEENGIDHEKTSMQVMELLKQTIRPEFLNRIDETIMFTPLNEQQIRDIVGLQIEGVHKMLLQSGVDLRITDDAIDYIAHEGYDPQFGARPVKRALQRLVLNELSRTIIAGKVNHQQPVIVELRDGELQFKN